MKTVMINSYGIEDEVAFTKEKYVNNDNLAVQAWVVENGKLTEPYCMVTVNLTDLDENHAFIDSNNCPREILCWLLDNDYALGTGRIQQSGFCYYPEVIFNEKFFDEVVCNNVTL